MGKSIHTWDVVAYAEDCFRWEECNPGRFENRGGVWKMPPDGSPGEEAFCTLFYMELAWMLS